MDAALIYVLDVYGKRHRIDANELYLTSRTQLTLFTSKGDRLSQYHALMQWHGKPSTIHRANIETIC